MYREAVRFFGSSTCEKYLESKCVSRRKFYTDKFECVIDFRTVDDENVSGNGRKLVGTQAGILMEIEKKATTSDLSCHVFVIADGIIDIMGTKLNNTKRMNTPFHMIIEGMTACGKTHYLLNMLEEEYKNHFNYIFIVCPTLEDDETYQNWNYLKDPDVYVIACDHDKVAEILQEIVKFAKNTNSLIIFDDCAASKDVRNRNRTEPVAFHGKHIELSTIVITQQLTSIAKPYRMNISKLVTFYNACKDDTKYIFNNYLNVEKDEEKNILETLKNNDYARLEILTVRPYTHKVIVP